MQRANSGVTLLELMIVVAVIGILAAIAYPSYRDQVRRSNRTEAKVALEQTAAALEKCFTRYMAYNDWANCPTASQLRDGGTFTTPDGHYSITGTIAATTFDLTATPQASQADDAGCASFQLDEAGNRAETGTLSAARCW